MSYRGGGGITGSNNIPLGTRRRFGGDDEPQEQRYDPSAESGKRGRSPARGQSDLDAAFEGARRRKRNRWGDANDNKAAGLMGLTTHIKNNHMTPEQLDAYVLHLRIEEISQKLRINDVVPNDKDRSPSPPPQYDNMGRRVNTREYRYRKRLEDERHKLVTKALDTIPDYHPPADYKRPTKTQEKVYVPVNDYPEINFIGLLIGPRGNTLKNMEKESGAKIAIRGKGSVKEGKGRSDAAHTSNQEEDLHCLIMADTEEKVNKAKKLIHNVVETAASIPEGQNELKRHQLRELAALNGTLRDDENQACQNCGEIGHRKYDCPQRTNYTANIICRVCGQSGHMARDCPERARGQDYRNGGGRRGGDEVADRDYQALMSELGAGGALTGSGPVHAIEGAQTAEGADTRAPWQRGGGGGGGGGGGAAPWRQRNENRNGGGDDGSRPWARRGGGGHDSYSNNNSYGGYGGYDQSSANAPAPWQQAAQPASYDAAAYANYAGYGASYGGYPGYAPPPGVGSNPYGNAGSPPPPPPGADDPPPPPPDNDVPPPPPPS